LEEETEPAHDHPMGNDKETASASGPTQEEVPDVPPDVAKAYRALEVPVGSDRTTVKHAYRRLMKRYHQDRFQRDDERRETAGEVSKRLNVAYDRILKYLDREGR
jgi:DnaJ-domain-containing protein 1